MELYHLPDLHELVHSHANPKSLRDVGIFSDQDHENFLLSLNTVGGQLAEDQKLLSRKEF